MTVTNVSATSTEQFRVDVRVNRPSVDYPDRGRGSYERA